MVQAGSSPFSVCKQVSRAVVLKCGSNNGAKGNRRGSLHHQLGQPEKDESQDDYTWAQGSGKGSLVRGAADDQREDAKDEIR
jgi:hypothetical protein